MRAQQNSKAPSLSVKLCGAIFILLLAFSTAVAVRGVSVQEPAVPAAQKPTASEATVQSKDAPATKSEPPVQPIPYSHKKHLIFGLKCQQCHINPEPGDRMTFPATSKCMACHVTIAKDKPSIQKLAQFAKSGQAIPWVRVYVVSSWVYWNHRAHLEEKMTCEMCHGQVAEMEVMTKISNVTTMAGCVDCHRKNDASTGCQYCHADK